MFARFVALSLLALSACNTSVANTGVPASADDIHSSDIARFASECEQWDDWDKPAEPFQIYGDTYYVGTCGIASILIKRESAGYVLIDSGTEAGSRHVLANLAHLGVDPGEVSLLLASHEHFDHVGGMLTLIEATGADLFGSPIQIEVISSGKEHPEDPQFGMHGDMRTTNWGIAYFEPQAIRLLEILAINPVDTPGHTPGAMSWQWESCDGSECKTIVYADSMSPVSRDGYRFSDHPEYVADYRAGIARIAALDCDILLTPHPSHSRMIERAATGTFEGGMTCSEYAERKSRDLDARLEREARGAE